MRLAIVGAGATGGFLGARLARAGLDVTLVARGPHLAAMRERGLRVIEADGSSFTVHPACTDDLERAAGADVVFVTLKAHALTGIAPALGRALGPGTAVVFAQNGIPWWFFRAGPDSTERTSASARSESSRWNPAQGEERRLESVDPGGVIAASIPARHVVGCVVYAATSLEEPGVIRHLEGERFSLAEPDGTRSERVLGISAALAGAGLRAPVVSRIRQEIWVKLLGNATLNPVSALTRTTLGELVADPGCHRLLRSLMLEVEAVGRALGIEPEIDVDRRLQGAARIGEHRTSMLQDVELGRQLEVGALVGSVVELGHQLGVPVPGLEIVNSLTSQLDRTLRRS